MPVFELNRTESMVKFEMTKLIVTRVEGRFHDFRGFIVYDAEMPAASSVEVGGGGR